MKGLCKVEDKKQISVRLLWLMICCCVCFSISVKAETIREFNVVSEAWEGSTNKDGSGLYWDIIRQVYEPVGIKVKLSTTAYARSVGLVKNEKKDAWVGSYLNEEEGVIYPKSFFDADVVAALFMANNDKSWVGEQSLAGKKVGWIKGYELHEYLDVSFTKKEFNSRKNVSSLLQSGRLDYYIDAQAELDSYFGKLIEANVLKSETIKRLNLYLAFANNERGQKLSAIFDERFQLLLASGEIRKLFDQWGNQYLW